MSFGSSSSIVTTPVAVTATGDECSSAVASIGLPPLAEAFDERVPPTRELHEVERLARTLVERPEAPAARAGSRPEAARARRRHRCAPATLRARGDRSRLRASGTRVAPAPLARGDALGLAGERRLGLAPRRACRTSSARIRAAAE